jgi:hypothetical protein
MRIGVTSIMVHVTVETDRGAGVVKLTEADVTYVAVDLAAGRKPRSLRG